MTELDQARPGHDDPAEDEPAPGRGHDHGDGGMQATLEHEDQLPTRQDARAATWDEDPDYDENNPATEYDGDLGALTADEDQLPTRQEARTVTWDGDAGHDDENDPGTQYDENSGAFADEGPDIEPGDLDQASDGQATPVTAGPDAPPADASDRPVTFPGEKDGRATAGTSEQVTGLETENARLGRTITDLQTRLERLERGSQAEPSLRLTGQERDTAQQGTFKAESPQTERRYRPTNEALTLGAAATGGVLTTVADYVPYLHADVAGIAASVVAVGAAAITWIRAQREARHGNRPED